MKFTLEVIDELKVIKLHEKHLEGALATEFKSQLVIMITAECSIYLAIDMSQIETIDSSGISSLLLAHRETSSIGGFCLFIAIKPRITDILKLTGISDKLYIFSSLKEAQKQIVTSENESENDISPETQEHFGLDEDIYLLDQVLGNNNNDDDDFSASNFFETEIHSEMFDETMEAEELDNVLVTTTERTRIKKTKSKKKSKPKSKTKPKTTTKKVAKLKGAKKK